MAVIRIIHHLSSSGGTVISKCLAALPSVVLAGELHPTTMTGLWNPYDVFQVVQTSGVGLKFTDKQLKAEFLRRMKVFLAIAERNERIIVIRNHAHSDYLGKHATGRLAIRDVLGDAGYELSEACTIRDPVDAWLGMIDNDFHRFLSSFDEYCSKVEHFLSNFENTSIVRYEDFTRDPAGTLLILCERLRLKFDPAALEKFSKARLSGNSGRAARSKKIEPLQRRPFHADFSDEVLRAEHYRHLAERFGYSFLPAEPE